MVTQCSLHQNVMWFGFLGIYYPSVCVIIEHQLIPVNIKEATWNEGEGLGNVTQWTMFPSERSSRTPHHFII